MKLNLLSFTLLIVLLIATVAVSISQTSIEEHRTLSLLRGSWEYATYEELSSIVFHSDSKLEIDKASFTYSIQKNELLLLTQNGTEHYQFNIQNDELSLLYPDGTKRKYSRKEFGEAEKQLIGRFYTSSETTSTASCLQFYEDMKFAFTEPTENSSGKFSNRDGYYRVEDNSIILAFTDGTIDEALIRFHTSDGMVDGLFFRDKLFDRELKPVIIVEYPPPSFPGPPPPPPCLNCPSPPPHPRPEPIPIPVPVHLQPVENKRRDFGTTRDASTGNESNSGHREQPTSRRGRP
jgi:hypothetical protein